MSGMKKEKEQEGKRLKKKGNMKESWSSNKIFTKIRDELFTGKDPSSLGILRIFFGLFMMLDIPQERGMTMLSKKWSIDVLIWPGMRNVDIPKWHYSIFKFQFFIVYFYAGLKKLDMDWVTGYSMVGLNRKWVFDPLKIIGLSDNIIDHFVVHICGLTFDLLEGFFLLFDFTRPFGFIFGGFFHLMNSQMFSIGMFPWTMLATMPIFCDSDWPKKWLRRLPSVCRLIVPAINKSKSNILCSNAMKGRIPWREKCLIAISAFYVIVQIILPYSHPVTKGYNAWTQGLYGYSWDMMVHSWSTQHIVIKVVDGSSGEITYLKPGAFTYSTRNRRWSSHPDMMKQYAICLSEKLQNMNELNIKQPRIYFDVWRSLNKRFQQRLVDPNVDMVTADWSPVHHSQWIRPLLTGLTPWRERLREIEADAYKKNNFSEVTFVADFPGLFLENFIEDDVLANISVLHGAIKVEFGGENRSLAVNEAIQVPRNDTHLVYVVSTSPACYMYESYNVTWQNSQTTHNGIDEGHAVVARMRRQGYATMTRIKRLTFCVSLDNAAIDVKRLSFQA
eukprot:gene15425-16999_t